MPKNEKRGHVIKYNLNRTLPCEQWPVFFICCAFIQQSDQLGAVGMEGVGRRGFSQEKWGENGRSARPPATYKNTISRKDDNTKRNKKHENNGAVPKKKQAANSAHDMYAFAEQQHATYFCSRSRSVLMALARVVPVDSLALSRSRHSTSDCSSSRRCVAVMAAATRKFPDTAPMPAAAVMFVECVSLLATVSKIIIAAGNNTPRSPKRQLLLVRYLDTQPA